MSLLPTVGNYGVWIGLASNNITVISNFFKMRPTVHEFKHADGQATGVTATVSVVFLHTMRRTHSDFRTRAHVHSVRYEDVD
jgi:hypothetical protein